MIPFPNIDPVLIKIGPLSVRWYGMMYLLGFASSYLLVKHQIKRKNLSISMKDIESLYSFLIIGLIVGARFGYVLFYDIAEYLKDPLEIFAVWHGGMSFHGGLIGSLLAGVIFCRKYGLRFWELSDLIIVTAPIGIGLGRLGNFMNAELYGRVTDVPWGMVFPSAGPLPRHPSQLYEFFLEGIVLFALLWSLKNRNLARGALTMLFLAGYGTFRFIVEFFRQPDAQLGYVLGSFTMGQVLSFLMIVCGLAVLFFLPRKAASTRQ